MTHAQSVEPLVVVYQITNRINGHRYIGYTGRGLSARRKGHFNQLATGSQYFVHRAMRKYGKENFDFEVMADFKGDEDLAKVYECEAIAKYKPEYNLTYGGDGGTLHESSRKKIGDANRGRKMPPSHGEKQRARMLGSKHSPEARAKISKGLTGRPSPLKGVSPSEETRRKISAANKGRVPWTKGKRHSEETKAKIRAQRWNHSDESIEQIKAARRVAWANRSDAMLDAVRDAQLKAIAARKIRVQCVEDGRVFDGCSDADRFYGFRGGLVSRIVKGTVKNNTGLTFIRAEFDDAT